MPLRFNDPVASSKSALVSSAHARLFAGKSALEEWGVHLRRAECPCLGPDPMPHACCLEQQKNLYLSFVSNSIRQITGNNSFFFCAPASITRHSKPCWPHASITSTIAPIQAWRSLCIASAEFRWAWVWFNLKSGMYAMQVAESMHRESVLATDKIIGM